MAINTIRNPAMCLMTHNTRYLTVLAGRILPFSIDLIMTGATGLQDGISRQINSQGGMNALVTSITIIYWLRVVMSLVAFQTARNITMLFMVTALTALLRMPAGELNQLLLRASMAICTGCT